MSDSPAMTTPAESLAALLREAGLLSASVGVGHGGDLLVYLKSRADRSHVPELFAGVRVHAIVTGAIRPARSFPG